MEIGRAARSRSEGAEGGRGIINSGSNRAQISTEEGVNRYGIDWNRAESELMKSRILIMNSSSDEGSGSLHNAHGDSLAAW